MRLVWHRKSKDFEYFSCKMDKNVPDVLEKYCKEIKKTATLISSQRKGWFLVLFESAIPFALHYSGLT